MSLDKIEPVLSAHVAELESKGILKGRERVITGIKPAAAGFSERYLLESCDGRAFLRMNSNGYLGLALHPQVIAAEARAAEEFGTGPGAVRFISGTFQSHVDLEAKLAAFHQREAGLVMSSAYASVMGVLPQFITDETFVISDALNHNCIINAIRLAQPAHKAVYAHLDMTELNSLLETNKGNFKRAIIVTDGVFSMRGDHAPLDEIFSICHQYEEAYEDGIITMVDDSHGVGALGVSGRGTEEVTGTRADILIATLGKALGVNGGYVVSDVSVINFIRETAPFYIYSNPITPGEAAAAIKSIAILDGKEGIKLLEHLRSLTLTVKNKLEEQGLETIQGDHPIVPILMRDTEKTSKMVEHLFKHNILVTGLNYPVVPKGEEEIRLQVCARHTEKDIDYLIEVLQKF
jgi:glycine C-acetyltransferase